MFAALDGSDLVTAGKVRCQVVASAPTAVLRSALLTLQHAAASPAAGAVNVSTAACSVRVRSWQGCQGRSPLFSPGAGRPPARQPRGCPACCAG